MAFFGSYVFHAAIVYPIVRGLTGFRVSGTNARIGALFVVSIAVVFGGFSALPSSPATVFGAAVIVLSTIYSTRLLVKFVSPERIPPRLLRLLALFGLARGSRSLLRP